MKQKASFFYGVFCFIRKLSEIIIKEKILYTINMTFSHTNNLNKSKRKILIFVDKLTIANMFFIQYFRRINSKKNKKI